MLVLLGVVCLLTMVRGDMYDVLLPYHTSPVDCAHGCADWSNLAADGNTRSQSDVDKKFRAGSAAKAGAHRTCAMPGNDPWTYDGWCYCRDTKDSSYSYCTPPIDRPTQINLQVVGPTKIVVNFVTVDKGATHSDTPVAELQQLPASGSPPTTIQGESGVYKTPDKDRVYTMHWITFTVEERQAYTYRVRSGSGKLIWSDWHNFTSLYSDGVTRFAIYGDMGVYPGNNMGNLQADAEDNIDFVAHIGDHAYEYTYLDGKHGDGYMDAFQPILSRIPWVAGIGNHEFLESDFGQRIGNITYGVAQLMPSKNTQFYSVNIGMLHLAVVDFDGYFYPCSEYKKINNCGLTPRWSDNFTGFREVQLKWLEADLAAVDRAKTPWVVVAGHHPLYCTSTSMDGVVQTSEVPLPHDVYKGCVGSGVSNTEAVRKDVEPLLLKYGVDVYMCGHEHNYETSYPMKNDTKVQDNYLDPKAPVHVLSGAGGAPEFDNFGPVAPWTRSRIGGAWTYSRVTISDAKTMKWEQIANTNGSVVDSFTIQQSHHGPFSLH